jgi:beta-lactamase superfamily II metal-dependent hydrolase
MSIVKSYSVGNGDMFFIQHNSDNFTIIDCCMDDSTEETIVEDLKLHSKGKGITRFISTHPDDDHIRGLKYLHEQMKLLNFYCGRNSATKPEETEDFDQYCALRDEAQKAFYVFRGCTRKWMNEDGDGRGNSGLSCYWPVTTNRFYQEELAKAAAGECWNNISIILSYGMAGGARMMWMGDLEFDFMENVKDAINLPAVDVLFAPHHGRDSGTVPGKWLEQMDPKLIVIGEAPSKHLNYYDGYDTITQNTAWDIVMFCETGKTHFFVSNPDYTVDFLDNEFLADSDSHGKYLGTLKTTRG